MIKLSLSHILLTTFVSLIVGYWDIIDAAADAYPILMGMGFMAMGICVVFLVGVLVRSGVDDEIWKAGA